MLGAGQRRAAASKQVAVFTLITLLLVGVAMGRQSGIAMGWDPDNPNKKVAAIWLAYLMARTAYRLDHKVSPPPVGELVPSFEEEIYARDLAATTYQEMRAKDKALRDEYWDDMTKVKSSGFLREYVWFYLKRAQWPSRQKPKNLNSFERWSAGNLGKHRPQTIGWLAVKKGT